MPVLSRRAVIAIKPESTAGTDAAPSVATAEESLVVYDLNFDPEGGSDSLVNEPLTFTLSGSTPVVGARRGTLSFSCWLGGSGTPGVAPDFGKCLISSGFRQDVTATPTVDYYTETTQAQTSAWDTTSDFAGWFTVTIYAWTADSAGSASTKLHKFVGGLANASFSFRAGDPPRVRFEYSVVAAGVSVTTWPTPSFQAHETPPAWRSAQFETSFINTSSPKVRSIDLDCGNEIAMRTDVTSSTGHVAAVLVARKPTVRFTVENPATLSGTDEDWWTAFTTGAVSPLTWYALGIAGNSAIFYLPNVGVSKVSRQASGVDLVTVDCKVGTSALGTGDDDIKITFY